MEISDEVRSRIKEEERYRWEVKLLLEEKMERPQQPPHIVFLNSRLVVAIAGGIALAIASAWLQSSITVSAENRARFQAQLARQYEMIETVANSVEATMAAFQLIGIATHRSSGLTDVEGNKKLKEAFAVYNLIEHKPNAVISQSRALFKSDEVGNELDNLDRILNDFANTENMEGVKTGFKDAEASMIILLNSMIAEIRRSE